MSAPRHHYELQAGAAPVSSAHASSERAIGVAALLTGSFMVAELVGGWISGSLALLADAGHMLTDVAALTLAWGAFRLARRPPDAKRSFGFDRFSVLAAFVNGLTLFVVAGWVVYEAISRLRNPGDVMGDVMLAVAVVGLVVNLLCFRILSKGDHDNLNVRAAALHVLGDLLGSVAAIVAAVIIMTTGWMPIDPILSVVVALIILRSAWRVTAESAHVLLEGAPSGLEDGAIRAALESLDGVEDVHHIHAWSITHERPMVTLHARIAEGASMDDARRRIREHLEHVFGFDHATIEIERGACGHAE